MKKGIIAVLLGALLFCACGRNEAGNNITEEPAAETTDTTDTARNELLQKERAEEAETPLTESIPAPERTLVISPADTDYDISFLGYDEDENPLGLFPAHVHVSLSETTDGVDAGLKRVTAVFAMDVSENPGPIYINWVSAFDEKTRISFETASEQNVYSADETLTQLYEFTFESDGAPVTVSMRISTENNYPDMTDTVEVICPADYDGTVFMIGYLSDEEYQALADYDFAGRTYTIDELPNSGEEMYYFHIERR